jgi:hypothetical protein
MNYRPMLWALCVALLVVLGIPASANTIGTVQVTDSCSGFTASITATGLGLPTATVDFTITLTPTSGTPITISDSFVVTRIPHSHGTYSGSYTQTWAFYGDTLNTTYTLTGKATFGPPIKVRYRPMAFSPSTLDCALPPPGSCQPSSSLGVLVQGKNVNSYVPNGAWDTNNTGLSVVPVEGSGTSASIATPNAVNSCAANPTTGEVVCTSNGNDVYLISGSTLNTTLSSGGDTLAGFSGGQCITCGVAMNATANKAVVTIGLSTSPSGSALQFLDLASNTFGAPVPLANEVSEDVLWDQGRDLVLSPNEGSIYDIYNHTSGIEFANPISSGFGLLDSAAEECSTGIALTTSEGSVQLYIGDLTQATFTPGTPGTWTTAQQVQSFPEFGNFVAGTSGIAIAQGSHLGIVTGEFGGNWMGVIQLPSTSGSGTPSVLDYAAVALPNTPDGNVFQQGLDPHTVTAYVSPNSGDAIGLMSNGPGTPPTWMAVIDLTKLLAAPRTLGTHYVDPSFDLILNGVVSYVAVP